MPLAERRILALLAVYAFLASVLAVPSFEGVTSWSSIGSLVPGMTALEAVGPNWREKGKATQYFTLDGDTGTPGNVTVRQDHSPSLFYIHNDQLWHYHNASMILPVNVLNSTASAQLPLQVVVGNKRSGVKGGSWRWQGTRLFYEQGSADNSGVYYSCQDTNGLMGLFFFLKGAPTPPGCTLFTVHSFMRHD